MRLWARLMRAMIGRTLEHFHKLCGRSNAARSLTVAPLKEAEVQTETRVSASVAGIFTVCARSRNQPGLEKAVYVNHETALASGPIEWFSFDPSGLPFGAGPRSF